MRLHTRSLAKIPFLATGAFTCLLLFFLTVTPTPSAAATFSAHELAALRLLLKTDSQAQGQYLKIKASADAALDDQPNARKEIISEGRLASDPEKIASLQALDDMNKIFSLAWTWRITGKDQYIQTARKFLISWAQTNISDGNPINETKFEPLIEAYDLLRQELSSTERSQIDQWLRTKAYRLAVDRPGQADNRQSHSIKVVALIGLAIQDSGLWQRASASLKKQIQDGYFPGGASKDFRKRDSLAYHIYATQPLLTIACAARHSEPNLFMYTAQSGASLERAIEFLTPFINGDAKHLEFANSTVHFDRKRANAGETSYSVRPWNPRTSVGLLAIASCLNSKYEDLVRITSSNGSIYPNWRAVVSKAITLARENPSTSD